jgi:hypothetical protein
VPFEIYQAQTSWTIARTVNGSYNDTAEANAKLIAAAPDLLTACKIGLSYLESDYTGKGGRDLSDGNIAILRAAIAKATNLT